MRATPHSFILNCQSSSQAYSLILFLFAQFWNSFTVFFFSLHVLSNSFFFFLKYYAILCGISEGHSAASYLGYSFWVVVSWRRHWFIADFVEREVKTNVLFLMVIADVTVLIWMIEYVQNTSMCALFLPLHSQMDNGTVYPGYVLQKWSKISRSVVENYS